MNRFYNLILPKVGENDTAELYIFGEIVKEKDRTFYEDANNTSSYSIVTDLKEAKENKQIKKIDVHINSLGGDTFEGIAIYNTLKSLGLEVTTYCDGLAASAASIIFLAGEKRVMNSASMLFLHKVWTCAIGNADELRDTAENVEKITNTVKTIYMENSNLSEQEVDALIDGNNHSGSWISADEALKYGMCTAVDQPQTNATAKTMAVLKNSLRGDTLHIKNSEDVKPEEPETKEEAQVNDEPVKETLTDLLFALSK